MCLVDSSRNVFVVTWSEVGSGRFLDEQGQRIGSIKVKELPTGKEFQLIDDDSLAATITKKILGEYIKYYAYNSEVQLLGRVDWSVSDVRRVVSLCDENGTVLFLSLLNMKSWMFEIKDSDGKIQAEISSPILGHDGPKRKSTISFIDNESPKLPLLVFTIIIDDIVGELE